MANEFGIDYQSAERGVHELIEASSNLSNLVGVIGTDVNQFIGQGWVGTDADAYKNSLDGLTKDLIAEADNITNFAKQIEDTAQRYAEDERSRATSAQGLNS